MDKVRRPRRPSSLPLHARSPKASPPEGAFLNKKHTYSYGAQVAHVAVDPEDRPRRDRRLRRGAGRRPHHQSADAERAR